MMLWEIDVQSNAISISDNLTQKINISLMGHDLFYHCQTKGNLYEIPEEPNRLQPCDNQETQDGHPNRSPLVVRGPRLLQGDFQLPEP